MLPLSLHIAAKFTLGHLFGAAPAGEQSLNQPLYPPPGTAMPCDLLHSPLTWVDTQGLEEDAGSRGRGKSSRLDARQGAAYSPKGRWFTLQKHSLDFMPVFPAWGLGI